MKADRGAGEDIEIWTSTMQLLSNTSDTTKMPISEAAAMQTAHPSVENEPFPLESDSSVSRFEIKQFARLLFQPQGVPLLH